VNWRSALSVCALRTAESAAQAASAAANRITSIEFGFIMSPLRCSLASVVEDEAGRCQP
jgi:hypothetical protein